jgi:hypothetical protein
VRHTCGINEVKWVFWGGGSKGQNSACGNEIVDSQHGTGVDGSSHPRTRDCYLKLEVFSFILLPLNHLCI